VCKTSVKRAGEWDILKQVLQRKSSGHVNEYLGDVTIPTQTAPKLYRITCSKISNIPYNLIFTTKFNDFPILITIISCDYLNLSLADAGADPGFQVRGGRT
jgi:hypothetical protein